MKMIKSALQKIYNKSPVLAFDLSAIPAAWYLAFWLRYNLQPFPTQLTSDFSLLALSILMLIQTGSFYYFKVYRGLWRFSSLNDVLRIIKSTLFTIALMIPVLYESSLLQHIPRSIFPLYSIILITLLCGARLTIRQYWDQKSRDEESNISKRVLIIGAGGAGESIARDLKRTRSYIPIGFLDDNQAKRGLEVHGIRVLGTIKDMQAVCVKYQINLIFIAIPTARSAEMRVIVEHCTQCNVPFRTLPSLQALASGRVEVNSLREVNIEDLLGRDQVELNWGKIAAGIQNKRIVVTGGGGSIGSELCRQILRLNPAKLVIIDNSEFNLYQIDMELKEHFPDIPIELALMDVIDAIGVKELFYKFKPEIVFHAASYKHVPMLENQIRIAVQNNVLGTKIVAETSVAVNVEKFILISTDKAVNPTSIMGTTKRVAEIYCQNLNPRFSTQFITVRFGNVLGSVGSVVPLFKKQLKKGGPLTVTHPDMIRYFMTIAEACQLILQAMVNGSGGEIFVLDMGEPIKISYLAEQMIRLSGKELGKDVHIQYTGLRPGEKLFEELFHTSEQLEQTEHEKLFKARVRKMDWSELSEIMIMLEKNCRNIQTSELSILLKNLVPESTCVGQPSLMNA